MPGTDIVLGRIEIVGIIHGGALNCLVVPFDAPDEWTFKQFVTREELEQFAINNAYVIKENQSGAESTQRE